MHAEVKQTLVSNALQAAPIGMSRVVSDKRDNGLTDPYEKDKAYLVVMQLKPFWEQDLWVDGKAAPRIRVSARQWLSGRIIVDVQDNGPSIAAHLAERVFEPFFTTRSEGTGIGLWLCRLIVRNHGGELQLQSSKQGTTMRLCLPLHDSPPRCTDTLV